MEAREVQNPGNLLICDSHHLACGRCCAGEFQDVRPGQATFLAFYPFRHLGVGGL